MIGLVPRPVAPALISPSVVVAFELCPAKAGFRLDPAVAALRRTGPAAAVGSIAHEVLAVAGGGAGFSEVWDSAAERWFSRLAAEWAPATPPRPEQWQNWALTRARVRLQYDVAAGDEPVAVTDDVREAWRERQLGTTSENRSPRAQSQPLGPLPWVEHALYDERNALMGIPDLVEEREGSVVVVDHKTGIVQSGMTPEMELQLRLYGALVQAARGGPMPRLEVRAASGMVAVVANDPNLVNDAVERAAAAREALAAAGKGEFELAGRPEPGRCGGCSFRGVCRAYLEAPESERVLGRAFAFEVLEIDAEGPRHGVGARVVAPAEIEGAIRITGFPFPESIQRGSVWGAAGFELLGGHARGHWTTLLHKLG